MPELSPARAGCAAPEAGRGGGRGKAPAGLYYSQRREQASTLPEETTTETPGRAPPAPWGAPAPHCPRGPRAPRGLLTTRRPGLTERATVATGAAASHLLKAPSPTARVAASVAGTARWSLNRRRAS